MTSRIAHRGVVCLQGGTVLHEGRERRADLLVEDGVVTAIEESLSPPAGALRLDASGCVVGPGLVDLHAHLREPGASAAETIESASRAAALGGYSAVVAMANTDPPIDCAVVARDVLRSGEGALVDVAVAASITLSRAGERLVCFAELADLGIRLFTDDGRGVEDGALLRSALQYAKMFDVILAEHCEDPHLNANGQMHEGVWSSLLGLPGQPRVAEEVMLARDLALVQATGGRMHFLHLSTRGSVDLIRRAKADGLSVTAEVTPHHLFLTDDCLSGYDPNFKVNPPLRERSDLEALRTGLADGTIDAIATDHAPHAPEQKELPFELCPPGMLGLETALSVSATALCPAMSIANLFYRCATVPARIAGLDRDRGHGGPIEVGGAANLCVFDPTAPFLVDAAALASRSSNCPYDGMTLRGRVRHTLVRGEPVVIDCAAQR
jgi:dihydroorotase